MTTYCATSGYSYKFWTPSVINKETREVLNLKNPVKNFYTTSSSQKIFEEYCKFFDNVEINCTRYQKLSPEICKRWYDNSPERFIYVVKMPLYITHQKKLNDFKECWDEFYKAVSELKHKLGALLFQFDDKFKYTEANIKKIETVKSIIPSNIKCAFELRDISWYQDDVNLPKIFNNNFTVVRIFYKNGGISGCKFGNLPDLKENQICLPDPKIKFESNFTYIRLHGSKGYCEGTYGHDFLLKNVYPLMSKKDHTNFVYFNNTDTYDYFEIEDFYSKSGKNPKAFTMDLNIGYNYLDRISTKSTLPSAICDCLFMKYIY